ncbi:nitroreductase family protein [Planobispora siamensis]|uniref:Nitroreductase n=1 Tax=Planobispora siamensis TaxID=936338 RepID=A0A8J3WPB4_9ACTN|nr:nitroreductase family protein [Planobispora siamensis]GIH95462.1 nitroreductase [Planobispora siamensis]
MSLETYKTATTSVPVHPLLAGRWSPRGFDAAHAVGDGQLRALLEAARWAPSANNSQPWRFLVARRGEEAFARLLDVLNPGNRTWAETAGALVLVAAETADETGRARPWALYDTGQAVAALAVQAQAEGLSVHQMGGFDAAAAREGFGLGDGLTPVVVVAVGRLDTAAELPEPLAARERAPRTRHPLDTLLLPAAPGPEQRAA